VKVDLEQKILAANDELAAQNRARFAEHGVFVLDLMASPGAGKTSTILATIDALRDRYSIAVIEGDIASKVDAEKVRAHGIPAVQINTGGACHLESAMVRRAVDTLDLEALDLIIIENVGNLVCPSDFDLGEDAKAMVWSPTEGEEKPLKYPVMFRSAEVVVVNKIDLLPFLDVDMDAFRGNLARVNPGALVLEVSAKTG